MIELLKAEGLSPTQAVTFGSMLGVIQVSARGLDFLGGGRWDGITTALIASRNPCRGETSSDDRRQDRTG